MVELDANARALTQGLIDTKLRLRGALGLEIPLAAAPEELW
jgi:hypothetical protein